jgi:hypothetical protein
MSDTFRVELKREKVLGWVNSDLDKAKADYATAKTARATKIEALPKPTTPAEAVQLTFKLSRLSKPSYKRVKGLRYLKAALEFSDNEAFTVRLGVSPYSANLLEAYLNWSGRTDFACSDKGKVACQSKPGA